MVILRTTQHQKDHDSQKHYASQNSMTRQNCDVLARHFFCPAVECISASFMTSNIRYNKHNFLQKKKNVITFPRNHNMVLKYLTI